MIKMIATDLDGTLLAGEGKAPEENIQALKRAMDAGVRVCLCSGRMIESSMPIAREIGVNAPMVLFNGAMVYDGDRDEILSAHVIPRETAVSLLRELEAMGAYVQIFPGKNYYVEKSCIWTEYYTRKIGVRGEETGVPLSSWLKTDVYKVLCLGTGKDLARIIATLAKKYPQLCFVKSGETHLEIVTVGVNKATGLQELAGRLGILQEEIMAFGDEANDLPMLEYAGCPYVMENAPDEVRNRVKLIAPRQMYAGVGEIVNLYLDAGRMGRG